MALWLPDYAILSTDSALLCFVLCAQHSNLLLKKSTVLLKEDPPFCEDQSIIDNFVSFEGKQMILSCITLALGWQSCSCPEKDNVFVCASPFSTPTDF